MTLIKLKKHERYEMIERILDYTLHTASSVDIASELRMYLKSGIPSGVLPYDELSDEALLRNFIRTFNLLDVLDGDKMSGPFLRSHLWAITYFDQIRTDKIMEYLAHHDFTEFRDYRYQQSANRKSSLKTTQDRLQRKDYYK